MFYNLWATGYITSNSQLLLSTATSSSYFFKYMQHRQNASNYKQQVEKFIMPKSNDKVG